MGKYIKTGFGYGIGTSPQLSLENRLYEIKINDIQLAELLRKKLKTNQIPSKGIELLKQVSNEKLKNVIKELYKPGSSVGDGGTADAIRYEKKTGKLVGGKSHIQKGQERLKNLQRVMKSDLNEVDKKIAKELYDDLNDALGGNKDDI